MANATITMNYRVRKTALYYFLWCVMRTRFMVKMCRYLFINKPLMKVYANGKKIQEICINTKYTKDKTFDICKNCGKEIRYDREDGYWDNLVKQSDGRYLWTPFNCSIENKSHEPINHISDYKGYYHVLEMMARKV